MPWPSATISEISVPNGVIGGPFGSELVRADYTPEGVPVIRGSNLRDDFTQFSMDTITYVSPAKADTLARNLAVAGDIVVTQRGTLGQVGIVPSHSEFSRWIISQSQMRLRCDPRKAHPKYVFYWLLLPSTKAYIQSNGTASGVPHINLGFFKSLRLPLPPLSTQARIVRALSVLDEKLELNRKTNETLEEMSRLLFQSWFVDFDPVRAKMKGRRPLGIDRATAALFPDELSDGDFGPLPKGWSTTTLGSLFSLDKGLSYKGEFLTEMGSPMINLGCFKGNGVFDSDKIKGYDGEVRDVHWVSPGDLILANTDMTQNRVVLGSPAIVPPHIDGRCLFSHHVFAARFPPAAPSALRLYCYHTLLRPEFRARAAGFATGTTVLALPRDAVLRLSVVVPPREILESFGERASQIRVLQEHNDSESRTLVQMRDQILPRLISGELRVREIDQVTRSC